MTYASVSCHREITLGSATIAIIQFILMILMFPALLFFVIYDAIVTQGASIKHYTNVKANKLCDI